MDSATIPLCVDLDGTLTNVDTLIESLLWLARRRPFKLMAAPVWLASGKAGFKDEVAKIAGLDYTALPYNSAVMEFLYEEKKRGRKLVLATAASHVVADGVARHLGIFDEVHASTRALNLSGSAKGQFLRATYGEFAYIGNATTDLLVWREATEALIVSNSPKLIEALRAIHPTIARVFPAL